MAEQQRMVISVDGGNPQSCMAFSENAIGLSSAGVTGFSNAAVLVTCVNDVLKVATTGFVDVSLERGGRTHLLGKRPIVLLPGDVLVVDGHCIEIVKIWQNVKPQSTTKWRGFSALKKMFSSAAACLMAALPSCHPRVTGDVPDPNYNPDDDAKVLTVDVQEMGEPEDPNYENYEWVKAQRAEEARAAAEGKKQESKSFVGEDIQAPEFRNSGQNENADSSDQESSWGEAAWMEPQMVDIHEMGDVYNTVPDDGNMQPKTDENAWGTSENDWDVGPRYIERRVMGLFPSEEVYDDAKPLIDESAWDAVKNED
ncbi:MAG: hypothetical protein IJ165_11615 [Proteobacteria bacterium]|nr:hypothetical protein [Pseudomonadota bacterium]